MARAEANWERLVRAALRGERQVGGAYGLPGSGIAGIVPSSLGNNVHIEEVLRTADEIQDEDPSVARILCEHAYAQAQNLDPNSEGRGVLQFKTGLMSVIRQKLAKRDGGAIDRSQDIAKLQEFYKIYRERHKVDELIADEMKLRESAVFSGNLGELERKTLKRKKVLATLKVLCSVIEDMTKEISPEDAEKLIPEEMKKVMQNDAARTEDVIAYNIIPLDALSTTTNAIVNFPEVRAAISALQYYRDLPRLPGTFSVPDARNSDMLDFLQCVFGFQEGNVKNQREHIVHLLANEQSRLGKLPGNEPKIDEGAVHVVFSKSLDNYIKWCDYLPIRPAWNNTDSLTKEKKLLYVCLYYLMWGEAANVRFLPEGLCYIFHNLARELEEVVLRKHTAESAESCKSNDDVSFLDKVISPLYEILSAEMANNKGGRAAHSEWRNYDDFNEFFWSLNCFDLGWPWKLNNPFFSKPNRKDKENRRAAYEATVDPKYLRKYAIDDDDNEIEKALQDGKALASGVISVKSSKTKADKKEKRKETGKSKRKGTMTPVAAVLSLLLFVWTAVLGAEGYRTNPLDPRQNWYQPHDFISFNVATGDYFKLVDEHIPAVVVRWSRNTNILGYLPVLHQQSVPNKPFRWLILELIGERGDKIMLAIRQDNLYIVGFTDAAGQWYVFNNERAWLIPVARIFRVGNDYPSLVNGYRNLGKIRVSRQTTLDALARIAAYVPKQSADDGYAARALGIIALTFCEGTRFESISAMIKVHWRYGFFLDERAYIVVKWRALSCALLISEQQIRQKRPVTWTSNDALELEQIHIYTIYVAQERIRLILWPGYCDGPGRIPDLRH